MASCINRFYASMIASFMHGTMLWVSAIASVENSNFVTPVERRVKRCLHSRAPLFFGVQFKPKSRGRLPKGAPAGAHHLYQTSFNSRLILIHPWHFSRNFFHLQLKMKVDRKGEKINCLSKTNWVPRCLSIPLCIGCCNNALGTK